MHVLILATAGAAAIAGPVMLPAAVLLLLLLLLVVDLAAAEGEGEGEGDGEGLGDNELPPPPPLLLLLDWPSGSHLQEVCADRHQLRHHLHTHTHPQHSNSNNPACTHMTRRESQTIQDTLTFLDERIHARPAHTP